MTQAEQQKAAKNFSEEWSGRGDEKQETQRFWIGLLSDVLGIPQAASYIEFEKRVKLSHTSFIDGYIPETKVLIEQKSIDIDLEKSYAQSDGTMLTPYQQAKRYASELPYDLRPRWIVVSNFAEIRIHDMNRPEDEPEILKLENLEKEYYRLEFLVDRTNEKIRREEEISIKAGELVKKLYNALVTEYVELTAESLRSLNILCVRLVFCLYAEDAGLFATRTSFEDYIKSFNIQNVRKGLIDLFKALDTELKDRDKYDETIKPFPYVNGGLFKDEKIEIPNFTQEIVDVLVNDCAGFDWSEISPTIFGAVFESTLNPETRRSGGMHYTSVENIHKVIDPLFMDSLNAEFESIQKITQKKNRDLKLLEFQEKLGKLTFLDPACGSGNFLTEAFLSLRRLENKVISSLFNGDTVLGFDEFIKVKISQFYGIEINDFAVTVAKTALWIAESQMIAETEKIISQEIDFLPLTTNAFIVEGNALRTDWTTLKPIDNNTLPDDGLFAGITTHVDGSEHHYDYIMGNPPFVGYAYQSEEQKEDVAAIMPKGIKNVDYVALWYYKAAKLIQNETAKCAFVSTNSITQGEQVAAVWKSLFKNFGIRIDYAYRTFRWDSESTQKAHVHCVIIGFSNTCHSEAFAEESNKKENCHSEASAEESNHKRDVSPSLNMTQKFIVDENGTKEETKNINGYLIDAPDVFIENRTKPLCNVPEMQKGSIPVDGGNLIIEADEYEDFIKKEPQAEKFIKPLVGSEEFINNKKRWCLWLVNANPSELKKCPLIMERVQKVKEMRLASSKEATRKFADYPTRFMELRQPETEYLLVPRVSSEQRKYVPIGYMSKNIISTDANMVLPNASLYHFGILTSSVHMAWMRAVCGRLKSDYRYSNTIVYNNFPWVLPVTETSLDVSNPCGNLFTCTKEQASKIEQTAQAILDARAKYPDSSLADLYDETVMPPELRKAHRENDRAVMQAYGFNPKMTESECVAELFKMYEKLTQKA
ncbi:MAG: DNA methyltransferase [Treponema sp.]